MFLTDIEVGSDFVIFDIPFGSGFGNFEDEADFSGSAGPPDHGILEPAHGGESEFLTDFRTGGTGHGDANNFIAGE